MSYLINKFNGEALVVLEDGTVDTTTSLGLVGRNYVGYGETQNENFVFLLENFANAEPPTRPLQGQLWFDSSNEVLKVYNGITWTAVGSAELSDTAPEEPQIGSLWVNTLANIMYVWTGSEWLFIGPEGASGFGITRARSTVVTDDAGTDRPVILLTINDTVIGVIANSSFRASGVNNNSITGFLDFEPGINLSSTVNFSGNLNGVAARATVLETKRSINGIGFDGSQDIIITSNTTNPLIPGSYINGNNFNGSDTLTWEVDATASNLPATVVARDANGNFSANTISADIVGNITGNVTSTGTSNFDIITATEFRGSTLTGNAFTASKLRNPVTINGVSFDGSENITIPVSGRDVTGDTLASNVKFSGLQSVGILQSLRVDDSGITVGSGNQLKTYITGNTPVIEVAGDLFSFGIGAVTNGVDGPDILAFASSTNTGSFPTINGSGWVLDEFTEINATNFVGALTGNADTATLAVTATNLQGGGTGAVPYQTASGNTSFVAPLANKVLRSNGAGVPFWGDSVFAELSLGDYLVGQNYDGLNASTIGVDATSGNFANKVVARDSRGDFQASTIYADLSGNASTASALETARTINGVAFDGSGNITIYDSTKAPINSPTLTGTPRSVTPPSSDNSTRIATTAYVQTVFGTRPFWAGATNLSNVISTYSNFPAGTRVSFWEERNYSRPANSNGGSVSISDRYRRTVEKQSNGTWINIG